MPAQKPQAEPSQRVKVEEGTVDGKFVGRLSASVVASARSARWRSLVSQAENSRRSRDTH